MNVETAAALLRPVRTERLTLRPATPEDADAVWAYRRLDEVNEWITSRPGPLEEYRAHFGDPARVAFTAVIQLGHGPQAPVIGDLMLRREDGWGQTEVEDRAVGTQGEVGWALDPAHTGRGYATEAVRELLRVAFEDHGLRRVVANCFADNESSWRLMERLGMRRETHAVRDSLHRDGRWLDSFVYALLAEEWRAGATQA
ncbi:GNAT family N-acetyltransferase [Georgenia sp. 311]|uniref:GNAT family N-acetyltransferase n=1 Tax=Georgenia sp. 311 TaxID=2585134 RepID=UPI001111B1B5|nr:GNAT family protein [Georgenia sp. 311]TNC19450.1 GNAT family N-acetyltransferase [Georgenia sp. 311]